MLIEPVQHTLNQQSQEQEPKHSKQVNRALSYGTILDHLVGLLLDKSRSVEEILPILYELLTDKPSLKREGRSYPRNRTSLARRLRYRKYMKKNVL